MSHRFAATSLLSHFCRAGSVLLLAASSAQAADSILIGHSAPLTGGNAEFGNDIRNGAQAYFAKVNAAGGIGGKKIELVTLDDRNDRKTAGENARKLIEERKAVALFGFASATLSLDALPHVADKKVPFVAPFTGADVMRKQSPYVFTLRASYEDELGKILNFWSSLGIQRVVVLHYDDEVGNQNYKTVANFMTAAGKVSTGVKIKRNAAVDEATYDAITRAEPQVVVITTLSGPAAQIVKELNRRNKPFLYSSLSFVGPSQLAKAGGTDAQGISIASVVPMPTNMSIPVVKECDAALKQAGKPLSFTSLEACIGAKVLVEAMKRGGGKDVTRESVYKGLQALGTYDAGGYKVSFGADARHGSSFVELCVISKNGGFRS